LGINSSDGLLFAVPGAALVVRVPHFASEMSRLGYPSYFLVVLGACKVLGATVILLPASSEAQGVGLCRNVLRRHLCRRSRAASGDEPVRLALPIFIAALHCCPGVCDRRADL